MSLQDVLFGSFVAPIAHSTRSNRLKDMATIKAPIINHVEKREVKMMPLHPPIRQKMVDALHKDQWISVTTLAKTIDCNPCSVSKNVKALIDQRRIVKKIVSNKGQTRWTYLKLRTKEDKRDIYSETKNRDEVLVKMMQERFCTIAEMSKMIGMNQQMIHKSLERIRKKYVYEKYFKQTCLDRVYYYMIVGEKK